MRTSKGFTLIELLVVIAIIALLSSVVLSSLNTARSKARDARRLSDVTQLSNAIALYASSNSGNLPIGSYVETYYPTQPMSYSGNQQFAALLEPYITPVNDPLRDGSSYYYYVIRPTASWISTNSWARLTSTCADKYLLVVKNMENNGSYRQDCPGTVSNMVIVSF